MLYGIKKAQAQLKAGLEMENKDGQCNGMLICERGFHILGIINLTIQEIMLQRLNILPPGDASLFFPRVWSDSAGAISQPYSLPSSSSQETEQ